MRHYSYQSMLSMADAYQTQYFEGGDDHLILEGIPLPTTKNTVTQTSKRSFLTLILSLLSFRRF